MLLALAIPSLSPAQPHAPARPGPDLASKELGLPVLDNYSARDYKGGPQVWTILQDRRGVMYFGHSGSNIHEYDGVTWRKIEVPSTTIRSLAMDDKGRIWVGAGENFGYLEPDSVGTLHYVSLFDKVPPEHRAITDIWQVLPSPQGTFFRAYERLFRWDGKQLHAFVPKTRFQALSMVDGHVYTAQDGIGLQEIVGDEIRDVPGGDAYKNSGKLFLHKFDEGRILVSARGQLLTLYDGQKSTPFPTEADDFLKKNNTYTSTLLPDGSICVTTLTGGVVIIERDGKIRQIIDESAGLASSNDLSAYADREGRLWIGLDTGVARVEIDSPVSIVSRTAVLDMARFKGDLYVSTGFKGASVVRLVFDPRTGRYTPEPVHGATQAWTLLPYKDPAGKASEQLLVATSDGVLKVEGDAMVPAVPTLHGLNEQTYDIAQSKKDPNRVYVGHSDGVGSIRWDGHTWKDEGRLPNLVYEARGLVEDADGNLWVAGGEGKVLRVEVAPTGLRDSKVKVLSRNEGLPDGGTNVALAADDIFVTAARSKNIFRWDAANHKFVVDNRFLLSIDTPDPSSVLVSTPNGELWSATVSSDDVRFGLFRRQPDGTWKLEEDPYRGLTRLDSNSIRTEPGGIVWISGGDGLVRFDQRVKPVSQQSFPTLIRQVSAGSKKVFGGDNVESTNGLRLSPNQNSLRFEFAAPIFGTSADTAYQYFLEGADKDWSAWVSKRKQTTAALLPATTGFVSAPAPWMAARVKKASTPSRFFRPGTGPTSHTRSTPCCFCS